MCGDEEEDEEAANKVVDEADKECKEGGRENAE